LIWSFIDQNYDKKFIKYYQH